MAEPVPDEVDEVERVSAAMFERLLGGIEIVSVYIGDRLGLYTALRGGPATPAELAGRTGMHERYAREWLEQQAAAGIVRVDETDGVRRFDLSPAHAEVLTDPDSVAYAAPFARMLVASASRLPELLEAYMTGGGVGWAEFGSDARDAQGDANRPWYLSKLGDALGSVPAVHDVLARPGARIADLGCGHGWSTIALARAYPGATVDGLDVDRPALESARAHAAGMAGVTFIDVADDELSDAAAGRYDAAFVFEALHDMPDPVGVLTSLRHAVADDGVVVIMDEAVADEFTAPGDEIERAMYGYSLLLCLPDSMSTPGSAATGTVMRRSTVERYARAAGFSGVTVLPIDDFAAFRFYLLER